MFSLSTKVPSLRGREERSHMKFTAPNNPHLRVPPSGFMTIAIQEAFAGRTHELILSRKMESARAEGLSLGFGVHRILPQAAEWLLRNPRPSFPPQTSACLSMTQGQ